MSDNPTIGLDDRESAACIAALRASGVEVRT